MKVFENTYKIDISNIEDFEKKTIAYFNHYQFLNKTNASHCLTFEIKGKLLDGWKMNPFRWESFVDIKIKNASAKISYKVEGVYLSTTIFSDFYNSFIANYINFIQTNEPFEVENKKLFQKAKKQSYLYNFYVFVFVILGIVAGNFLATIVKNNLIKYLAIVLVVWGGEKLLASIASKKQKNNHL